MGLGERKRAQNVNAADLRAAEIQLCYLLIVAALLLTINCPQTNVSRLKSTKWDAAFWELGSAYGGSKMVPFEIVTPHPYLTSIHYTPQGGLSHTVWAQSTFVPGRRLAPSNSPNPLKTDLVKTRSISRSMLYVMIMCSDDHGQPNPALVSTLKRNSCSAQIK